MLRKAKWARKVAMSLEAGVTLETRTMVESGEIVDKSVQQQHTQLPRSPPLHSVLPVAWWRRQGQQQWHCSARESHLQLAGQLLQEEWELAVHTASTSHPFSGLDCAPH